MRPEPPPPLRHYLACLAGGGDRDFCVGVWGTGRGGLTTFPTVQRGSVRRLLGGGVPGRPCGRAAVPAGVYTHP
jgi:hypothetical protein